MMTRLAFKANSNGSQVCPWNLLRYLSKFPVGYFWKLIRLILNLEHLSVDTVSTKIEICRKMKINLKSKDDLTLI